MKRETLKILEGVQRGLITPEIAQEKLFVLFGVSHSACLKGFKLGYTCPYAYYSCDKECQNHKEHCG